MLRVGVGKETLLKHLAAEYQISTLEGIPRKQYDEIVSWVERGGK